MNVAVVLALLLPVCLGSLLNCGGKPDLVIVMDSSTSIRAPQFIQQRAFINELVSELSIGPDVTQVSVVSYSDRVRVEFPLNRYDNRVALMDAISQTQQLFGDTNTGAALDSVRQDVLTPQAGSREVGPKVVIVLTDGRSQRIGNTRRAANALREAYPGIVLVAIGIGNRVNAEELNSIANSNELVFSVGSFGALNTIKTALVPIDCPTTTTEPPTTTPPDCSGNPDLVFVLDRSTSVNADEFQTLKNFVTNFVTHITVGPENTQVSIVTFATDVRVEFYLNRYSSTSNVLDAIANLAPGHGNTRLEKALRKVRNDVLTFAKGVREHGAKVVIVVTDGRAQFLSQTQLIADQLANDHVQLYGVGVGTNLQLGNIFNVTYSVNDYDALESIRTVLSSEACSVTRSWTNPFP